MNLFGTDTRQRIGVIPVGRVCAVFGGLTGRQATANAIAGRFNSVSINNGEASGCGNWQTGWDAYLPPSVTMGLRPSHHLLSMKNPDHLSMTGANSGSAETDPANFWIACAFQNTEFAAYCKPVDVSPKSTASLSGLHVGVTRPCGPARRLATIYSHYEPQMPCLEEVRLTA